jgi:XTP/dITP diphosphohydrolase
MTTRELLVATHNHGKLREIRQLLSDMDIGVTSLKDYEGMPVLVEDGETFADNALKKALTIARHTHKLVLGEDSGLEVAALGNQPGVYSARFAGDRATDEENNAKLLQMLEGVPTARRQARYWCFAVLAQEDQVLGVVSGSCDGVITEEYRGRNGFGYDPLFLIPQHQKTFGELDPSVKAQISHRARALAQVKEILRARLDS